MAAHLAGAALRPLLLPADARLATMEHSALARNNSTEGTEVDTSDAQGSTLGQGPREQQERRSPPGTGVPKGGWRQR